MNPRSLPLAAILAAAALPSSLPSSSPGGGLFCAPGDPKFAACQKAFFSPDGPAGNVVFSGILEPDKSALPKPPGDAKPEAKAARRAAPSAAAPSQPSPGYADGLTMGGDMGTGPAARGAPAAPAAAPSPAAGATSSAAPPPASVESNGDQAWRRAEAAAAGLSGKK